MKIERINLRLNQPVYAIVDENGSVEGIEDEPRDTALVREDYGVPGARVVRCVLTECPAPAAEFERLNGN